MPLHPAMIAFYDYRRMHVLDATLARRFLHGTWHATRQLEAVAATAGALDLSELMVLEYAASSDLGPSAIAEALRLPDHTVSRLLGRLEAAGLVERRLDPDDARRRTLSATSDGRAQLARLHDALQAHFGTLLRAHDADRQRAFATVLTTIVAAEAPAPPSTEVNGSGATRSADHPGSGPRRP
jgi:DNA-binding MarR family transcriptional regulator